VKRGWVVLILIALIAAAAWWWVRMRKAAPQPDTGVGAIDVVKYLPAAQQAGAPSITGVDGDAIPVTSGLGVGIPLSWIQRPILL
jgi:hypothetical protein